MYRSASSANIRSLSILTQKEILVLILIGHRPSLLLAPFDGEFVPNKKGLGQRDIGVLSKDVRLDVMLKVTEVPPMGTGRLQEERAVSFCEQWPPS